MRKWLPLATVLLGTFMLLIDVTVVNVALPAVAGDLKTSFGSLQWVVESYALVLAALVLGTGSIADLLGHRRTYLGGLSVFALSSLACGLAPGPEALIAARVAQGIGAAAMLATVFTLLNGNYSGRDRGTAYGLWGAVAGISASVGPIIGGLITEAVSWRWIFFVNLPLSVIAITLGAVVLGDVHASTRGRVDVLGVVTFTAAVAALVYGLIRANEDGWGHPAAWAWITASPVLLALFAAVELRATHPMLDLRLLLDRSFAGVLLAAFFLSFSAFAGFTYTSVWLQSVLGMSPIEVALAGSPLTIASFAASVAVGRLLHSAEPEPGPVIACGLALIGAGGIVGGLLLHGPAGWDVLVPGHVLTGVGAGVAAPALSSTAMSSVPAERGGMAAGAVNTARQLGLALGVAVLGAVFSARAGHVLSTRGVPDPAGTSRVLSAGRAPVLLDGTQEGGRTALDSALRAASAGGVGWTLWVSGIAAALACPAVLVLLRRAPRSDADRLSVTASPERT
ncbi:EmrB/QacA subfamily drug resistance transporter [Saccharothrix coeruleofusca]|uniref:MFS transporter n=1 Tax=Saccharothrix coeruleofusca TaxID=33919 RepID=UPI001AE29338|nr:MFS transporter [Saccharothrix coeruleofusca]MBP2334109.1 EmrB/QacA subfamily drug resistance transporter [Saccharothrix coeruleofusca]